MPFVTVKPKFQVTIPAKLRRGIDLREGDIMEATLLGDGILFRPKEVVDRGCGRQPHRHQLCGGSPHAGGSRAFRGRDHEGLDHRNRQLAP